MFATELAADTISPVDTTDTLQRAIDRMLEFRIRHLPVVHEHQFIGLLAESDITESDHNLPVSALPQLMVNSFVYEEQHIYDAVRLFHEHKLTVVPVLSAAKVYIGLITLEAMNSNFATLTAASETGGIIVLEINSKNNSMAHMAQIVESDNAQILSSYVRAFPESTRIEVTLKLNKPDVYAINAAFLRYGYEVKSVFNYTGDDDDSNDHYDSFMHYLNM